MEVFKPAVSFYLKVYADYFHQMRTCIFSDGAKMSVKNTYSLFFFVPLICFEWKSVLRKTLFSISPVLFQLNQLVSINHRTTTESQCYNGNAGKVAGSIPLLPSWISCQCVIMHKTFVYHISEHLERQRLHRLFKVSLPMLNYSCHYEC